MFWIIATVILGIVGLVGLFFALGSSVQTDKNAGWIAVGVSAALFVVVTFFTCIHTVGSREVGIVKSFSGTITGTTGGGVVFTAPWSSVAKENIGVQREDFVLDSNNSAVSSDQQAVYADLSLNYEVLPGDVLNLYRTVGPNWKQILLDSRVLQDFKEVTSGFTAEQITTRREQLRQQTKMRLATELAPYSVKVVDFFVKNISYTSEYQDAINAKNVTKQEALQAQAKVAQARAEAAQAVATARGDAESIRLRGRALRDNPSVLTLEAIDKLNPNAQVVICTGTGSGNCPSFLPNLTGAATPKASPQAVSPTTSTSGTSTSGTTTGG